jgi:hypothetical protein
MGMANAFLIEDGRELVLIDAGFPRVESSFVGPDLPPSAGPTSKYAIVGKQLWESALESKPCRDS